MSLDIFSLNGSESTPTALYNTNARAILMRDPPNAENMKIIITIPSTSFIIKTLFKNTPKKLPTALPIIGIAAGDIALIEDIKILSVLYNIYPCTEKFMTTIII